MVAYLTDELVRLGHDVTLFASGDSVTAAKLVACAPRALRLDSSVKDPIPFHILMLEKVRSRAHEFDVLHFHTDGLHLPLFRPLAAKTVTTLHGRLDLPGLAALYGEFAEFALVSISDAQRAPLPGAHWAATVHHGLPSAVCPFNPAPRARYLGFLGRTSPEKGLDRAIAVARSAGMHLRIAAKVDSEDERYFRRHIAPLLDDSMVKFVGEVGEREKPGFLGNATALLFPIDWPEPFGLAMIEAMSCGTPVIAFEGGAVGEIVEDGVTGFVVRSVEEAAAAVPRAAALDRGRVRRRFDERFGATRMAREYLAVYRALGSGRAGERRSAA